MSLRNNARVVRFVEHARNYCNLVENPQQTKSWLREILIELSAVYAAGLVLPKPELPEQDVLSAEFDMQHDEWRKVFNALGNIFGKHSMYRTFFEVIEPAQLVEPPDAKQESMFGHLNDDVADIYRDLKSGMAAWDSKNDEILAEVVFEWRFSLQSHWGHHAVDAMRALNELVHTDKWPDDDSIDEYLSSRV